MLAHNDQWRNPIADWALTRLRARQSDAWTHNFRHGTAFITMRVRFPHKYHAVTDGVFDSRAERSRHDELAMLEQAGVISDLRRQVPYAITPDGCPARHLVVDFEYRIIDASHFPGLVESAIVCEDVKSPATETPVWRLKWHLARYHHQDRVWVTSYRRKNRTHLRIWPSPPKR